MSQRDMYPGHFVLVNGVEGWKCDVAGCDTIVGPKPGDIASHRKVHQAHSAYSRDAEKFSQPVLCTEDRDGQGVPCGASMDSRNNMLSHYRRHHGHKGNKNIVFEKYPGI
ncbi:hypothetical protein SLS62_008738 [Diatrype stigma]|uniref:C2H2-type domain-containing protein n=1 Tax=Diatrype stigma TaxID=117547 RepID=A0AAN9YKA6_9PEZI